MADPTARKDRAVLRTSAVHGSLDTSNTKFINKKSSDIAEKSRNAALSEIFDVLLHSVEYDKQEKSSTARQTVNNMEPSTNEVLAAPSAESIGAVGPELTLSEISGTQGTQQSVPTRPESDSPVVEPTKSLRAPPPPPPPPPRSPPETKAEPVLAPVPLSSVVAVAEPVVESGDPAMSKKLRELDAKKRGTIQGASESAKKSFSSSSSTNVAGPLLPQTENASVEGVLSVRQARPDLLADAHISAAVTEILGFATSSGYEQLTRDEFVAMYAAAVERRVIVPLNFLLSTASRGRGSSKPRSAHSDEQAAQVCTSAPTVLPASRKSSELVQQRYSRRQSGQQKVEDSLHDCEFPIKNHLLVLFILVFRFGFQAGSLKRSAETFIGR